jgi:hypothetical protein
VDVDTAIARLKRHRALADRAQASAASDPDSAANTEWIVELAERVFRKRIMDAEGVSETKH